MPEPRRLVVDASALVKLVTPEADSVRFGAWWSAALADGAQAFAPHLLRYEVGQHLARTAGGRSASERGRLVSLATVGIQFLDAAPEEFAPPLSYYDASYVALAKSLEATLVTYDAACIRVAKREGVPTESP